MSLYAKKVVIAELTSMEDARTLGMMLKVNSFNPNIGLASDQYDHAFAEIVMVHADADPAKARLLHLPSRPWTRTLAESFHYNVSRTFHDENSILVVTPDISELLLEHSWGEHQSFSHPPGEADNVGRHRVAFAKNIGMKPVMALARVKICGRGGTSFERLVAFSSMESYFHTQRWEWLDPQWIVGLSAVS